MIAGHLVLPIGLGIAVLFAYKFTDWHQVKVVEEKCKHCNHTHKKYI